MMKVHPKLPFSAKQCDVSAVDDDDVVAAVVHRVVDGLVLALQHPCDLLGRLERVLPLCVIQVPVNVNNG